MEVLYVFGSLSGDFVSLSVKQSGILYVFVRLSVEQNGILYVFVRLSGAFVCFYESECEIKLNFVRQSGTSYVFESLSETKWNFVFFFESE